jgi:hypothetical protein
MNVKAMLGTVVVVVAVSLAANNYIYLPQSSANPAPGTPMVPFLVALTVIAVVEVLLLDWVNQKINNAMRSALIIALSQIALVDIYYVLNGTRSIPAALASAVTLLLIWMAGGFVYGKLATPK